MTRALFAWLVCVSILHAQGTPADYARSDAAPTRFRDVRAGGTVDTNWQPDGTFWYRRGREVVVVDPTTGKKDVAADASKYVDPEPGARPAGKKGFNRPRGKSPWTVTVQDGNLFIAKEGEEPKRLTRDGRPEDGYETFGHAWSPDNKKLVAMRTAKGDGRKVTMVASSPRDQFQPKVVTINYDKPGDKLAVSKPHLFDVEALKEIPVSDELFPNPFGIGRVRWDDDGKAFTFVYNQRGHQVLRLVEVNAESGKARAIVDEQSKTFIDYAHKQYVNLLGDDVIWMSERDGWNHLYRINRKDGTVANQVTKGEWVVRGVDRVDGEKKRIWFTASGIDPKQDPYYIHHCRINFDGTGLVDFTPGDGTHTVRSSPDGKYLIDTYSRVDAAPITELRSADDGKLITVLETGDLTELKRAGWQAPQRWVAKGRDGKTEIHGVIFRPTNFNPDRIYPVIEQIYAGPQGSFVPKEFRVFHSHQAMAELGFIVVQIDGMGTSNRSKAFHDVCAKNLADAGFPDRILWMKSAEASNRQMDLTRVGVYGGSAGGQNALGALLFHGDFYKAAAADCGCHDNRMDKVWWNELWMGHPLGDHYAKSSNVDNAHRLTGKLLLTVGELDTNVDPASTMQVVNALIKANKDFELVVFPNGGHGAGSSPYGSRRRKDFFVRHLMGVEPPDRNKVEPKKEEPKKAEPKKVEPKKAPEPPPAPDLAALVKQPVSEMRTLVRNFESDRGALRRKYSVPAFGPDFARLRKFYSDWQAAIGKIDATKLTKESAEDLAALTKRITKESEELDAGYVQQAEIARLVPFSEEIGRLVEAERSLVPIDPVEASARLAALRKQVDDARESAAKGLPSELTKAQGGRAADAVTAARGLLKGWHGFYTGYDPMFTWWTATGIKECDAALERYAAVLKEKAGSLKEEKSPSPGSVGMPSAKSGPSDIPDATGLIAKPSELAPVIQRYQGDTGPFARVPGLAELSPADRRAFQSKQFDNWAAAMGKIDFDSLSRTGQVDWLLLRNQIEKDRSRSRGDGPGGGGRQRPKKDAGDEIGGRPIGREALLTALASEMIAYSPEELVDRANREYAWCLAEMKKASNAMGFGDDWKKALEKVKTLHVAPGGQPKLVRDLALEAIDYLKKNDLVTVPPLAEETWRMDMMTPERQKFSPFFTGGEVISVAFPTDTMSHDAKMQSLRGNNIHFARATVHHELIPGHHLQQFMIARHQPQRAGMGTPFWTEGWALYWEFVLYEKGFPKAPEDKVGFLCWRMHRCARIIFSLGFHLGTMKPQECIDFLVEKVGFERDNATAEVRRSFVGGYPPLYQAAYMVGGKQIWALRQELVTTGKMTDKQFHDAILKQGAMPIEMVRLAITDKPIAKDHKAEWKFWE